MIKTWQQRCEDHGGIVTNQMIRDRMQEEIDELRQALAQPVDLAKVGEVGVWGDEMTDLRKAAEQALEALETLWNILDDIDTASDMAKENDAWYRKRVEALQKKRWDTMITTDGYKLKGGPVEALRQALAQHVDAVNMSQERVDETVKLEHDRAVELAQAYERGWNAALAQPEQEPFIYVREDNERPFGGYEHCSEADAGAFPVYTAPPKKEWVGLTDEEIESCNKFTTDWRQPSVWLWNDVFEEGGIQFAKAIEAKLKEKNSA
jgi:hypothetical protein